MKIIGVTGGIGAGKSAVLDYLKDAYGAHVEKLDDLAKTMICPGGRNYQGYIDLFGPEIVLKDGTLDRAKIASKLFSDDRLLHAVNKLVNPAVKEALFERIKLEKEAGTSLFVVESAVLFSEHYDAFCNETWYIDANDSVRAQRLRDSRGYDGTRILETMKRQSKDESFRKECTCTIDNSGSFDETKKQIDRLLLKTAHGK